MGLVGGPPRRGDVFLVSLDPTTGREIRKTRLGRVPAPTLTKVLRVLQEMFAE